MDPLPFVLVLAAAVMHATWNAIVKMGGDPLIRLALVNGACAVLAVPVLPFVQLPAPEAWGYLALSTLIHNAYYLLLTQSYRFGDLSYAYPLARGSAPLLVAAMAYVFAGEKLSLYGIAAVCLICAAILSLAFAGRGRASAQRPDPRGTAFALLTGVSIAGYTLSDGLGARLSGDPVGYIMALYILEATPILAFALIRRRDQLLSTLRSNWRPSLVGGLFAFLAYAFVVWALGRAPMTFVSALRETSVVIAALIGSRLLGEPFGGRRLAAASVVAFGVVLLHVAPKL